jgi:transglutaminase-like putative cysteine protease
MTKSILLRGAAVFLAAVSPVLLCAQFQPLNPDELKMTSDPKAPGTDAVYLEINQVANDPLHYQSYYARIKVLTDKGKELATVELPYLKGSFKIADIRGRTIHPDGTVIPLTVKPEDLMVSKTGETQVGRKVFSLPSVEAGSILEYSYQIQYGDNEYSSPEWEIQKRYFVHKAHYQFTPFKAFAPNGTPDAETSMYLVDDRGRVMNSLIWWNRLPEDVKMQTSVNGSYSVDLTDIPPIPDEDQMPPLNSFIYRVFFYYKPQTDPKQFWPEDGKLWAKDVDKFAEPSKEVKAVVDGLVAAGDSDLDKAKKLYDAVEALDNTDYSREKSASEMKALKIKEAKHAQDTWAQKSGSSEDIAMLYLAMLRAAGLTAYAIKVVDREEGLFDPTYLSLSQLDTTLVVLSTGGKEIVLDPGEKMCPFQTVNWRHSSAGGLGQSPQGVAYSVTPMQLYKDNVTIRLGDVYLDAQGGITGHFSITMTGQRALHWRQKALGEDDAELKKEFDREELDRIVPEGVEAHVDHFLSMNDPYTNLMAVVDLKGALGTATPKRLILPGYFFESRGTVPFVKEDKRMEPVDMYYGDRVTDEVTYHLPDGVTVEGAPPDANISWPAHAVFVAKSLTRPGQIVIGQTLSEAFTFAKPEEYQDLRGFYQKVAAADQEQLVLTMSPAGAVASPAAPAAQTGPVGVAH